MVREELKTDSARRRLVIAFVLLAGVYAAGTVGYYLLGRGRWSLTECAYMTVISVTTVGYGEVLKEMHAVPYARLFTSFLLISGAGLAVYAVSMLTTFLVEGEFFDIGRKRRMLKGIKKMSKHILVCGIGRTGINVLAELQAARWPFVAVDIDPEAARRCREACNEEVRFIQGDASDEMTLISAGIQSAYGIVAALPGDKDNIFVVLTARSMKADLRIVAKAVDARAESKLRSAGADGVVSVNQIGGVRLASEMVRPSVVSFIDLMMRDADPNLRFEELTIPKGSCLDGRQLRDANIRKESEVLVVAVAERKKGRYVYSPGPGFRLRADMTLVIIGETSAVARLRESSGFNPEEESGPREDSFGDRRERRRKAREGA